MEFARQFQASTVYAPVPPDFFEGLVAESVKLPARLWRAVFDGILAFDDATGSAGSPRRPSSSGVSGTRSFRARTSTPGRR